MKTIKDITIVVPTLNEAGNVRLLTERVHASLSKAKITYNILFIDDHSTDGTVARITKLSKFYPVRSMLKIGKRGKAQSVLQGIEQADTSLVCMIDADLQYPPEDIAPMVNKLIDNNADVTLSNRLDHETSALRRFVSKGFNLVFTRLLFGIRYDTQSGLKVFKRNVFQNMKLTPSPWSFDLEFIVECLKSKKKILTHDIKFGTRNSGEAKVNVIKTSMELAKASMKLRTHVSRKKIKYAYNQNVILNARIAKV